MISSLGVTFKIITDDEYKSNNTPDTKFGMDDIYNTKMSPEPSSNEQRQTQIQKEIDELNETIHTEN